MERLTMIAQPPGAAALLGEITAISTTGEGGSYVDRADVRGDWDDDGPVRFDHLVCRLGSDYCRALEDLLDE